MRVREHETKLSKEAQVISPVRQLRCPVVLYHSRSVVQVPWRAQLAVGVGVEAARVMIHETRDFRECPSPVLHLQDDMS